jgi:hypothetical protein
MSPSRQFTAILSFILIAGCAEKKEPRLLVDLNIRELGDVSLSGEPEVRCLQDADCNGGYCWYPESPVPGEDYQKGFCRECEDDAACDVGLLCDHRFCRRACQSNVDCQEQERCAGGFCRAAAVGEVVFCNDGNQSVEIYRDQIELACSDGDCGLLELQWLSGAAPLELEPGGCTALRASLALPDLGEQQVVAVVPTGDKKLPQVPLVFCARAVEAVCAPGLDDPGCHEQLGCSKTSCCEVSGIIDLVAQTSLGTPPCDPGDTVWQCVEITNDVTLDTYQMAPDHDMDGIEDDFDNCPFLHNRDQADQDGGCRGDPCDNCPETPNERQNDMDGDQLGDECDPDTDGDGHDDTADNCPQVPNPGQENVDRDELGDVCDPDIDGDEVLNYQDNCPMVSNPFQEETDPDTIGEACFTDNDVDGVHDHIDNCPLVPNPGQENLDGDQLGDLCDFDRDGDEVWNESDNCPETPNPEQVDRDRDFQGDICDQRPDEGYCYMARSPEDCMDAAGIIDVRAGPDRIRNKGEKSNLAFWINRPERALSYEWTVVSKPPGSGARIQNPAGMTGTVQPAYPEYAYFEGWQPSFRPDKAGEYVIQVSIQLAFEDNRVPDVTTAVDSFKLTVE